MTDLFPTLLTLAQVLERMKGIVGRTYLLQHLRMVPEFEGRPTHRRVAGRIVFYPEDVRCLLASLEECSSRQIKPSKTAPLSSAQKRYEKTVKLLQDGLDKFKSEKKSGRRR